MAKRRLSHPLASAVLRQLGGGKEAIQTAIDAANHGADGGFNGFSYYSDTVKFAKRNLKKILPLVEQEASDIGEPPLEGWRSLKSVRCPLLALADKSNEDHDLVMNALAWWALETVGRALEDEGYRENPRRKRKTTKRRRR